MLIPVMPLPMIMTSAEDGKLEQKVANRWGGVCQYDCVGEGVGSDIQTPAKVHASARKEWKREETKRRYLTQRNIQKNFECIFK